MSEALWEDGVCSDSIRVSRDTHRTKEQAEAVCRMLNKDGFGGEGVSFPLSTEVKINPDYERELLTKKNDSPSKAVQALKEIYEVWAGSEGYVPVTAPEAYQKRLIEQMRDIASEALKEEGEG